MYQHAAGAIDFTSEFVLTALTHLEKVLFDNGIALSEGTLYESLIPK